MDFRKRVGDDRFADVSFADLQTDPIGTLANSYKQLGLEFTDAARAPVRAVGDGHQPGSRGRTYLRTHRLRPDAGRCASAFSDYLATYDATA